MMVKLHIDTLISIEFQHHPLPILKKIILGEGDDSGEKNGSGEKMKKKANQIIMLKYNSIPTRMILV